ncbi:putative MSHA-type pilus biogenesis protein MshL [Magnetofaba australis IT-1]|uniref:Putative MSHA-type pilus biogenesis protein MshL n=2 Tax=Magnetofaba TaxID=1472292 RepID=A0A1Y2K0X8_9PROT|nr:putative MSHA-type pilus biogenesis protein MshL [Magnetofaba australis IT-1]
METPRIKPDTAPLKAVTQHLDSALGRKNARDHAQAAAEAPPEAVLYDLLPPAPTPPLIDSEPRFELSVEDAPVRQVLRALVAGTQYGLVLHPDVEGSISLTLRKVTVAEGVETICRTLELDCTQTAQGFEVRPRELISRTYHIGFPNIRRSGASTTNVTIGSGFSTSSSSGDTGTTTSSDKTGSNLVTESGSDFWQELAFTLCNLMGLEAQSSRNEAFDSDRILACRPSNSLIQSVQDRKRRAAEQKQQAQTAALNAGGGAKGNAQAGQILGALTDTLQGLQSGNAQSKEPNNSSQSSKQELGSDQLFNERSLTFMPQSGKLVARGYRQDLTQLESFLDEIKSSLTRQVILEAKVVEVELSEGFQSGINWSTMSRFTSGGINAAQTGGGDYISVDNPSTQLYTGEYFTSNVTGIPSTYYTGYGGAFTLAAAFTDFGAFLEFLRSQGEVSVLSNPRIATLNNQKAVIKVGSDEYYITGVDIETDANGNDRYSYEVSPFFSGVSLDVSPQINDDDTVMLHIHPTVTEVTNKRTSLNSGYLDLASSASRESDTMVWARNGEIVVIGGLMQASEEKSDDGAPGLSEIPLLGNLFKHQSVKKSKSELVILVRPTIIDPKGLNWRRDIQQTRDRIQSFSAPPKRSP